MFSCTSFLWILVSLWMVSTFSIIPPEEDPLVTTLESATTAGTLDIEGAVYEFGVDRGNPNGGIPFNDKTDLQLPYLTPCIGVELIWYPEYLFSLRFIYTADDESGSSASHGNATGFSSLLKEKFMLRDGERITNVTTYVGTHEWTVDDKVIPFVLGIQFDTNKGRLSQLYGSNEGEKISESYDGFTFGYALGRSATLVDLLQIIWRNQEIVKTDEGKRFAAFCPEIPKSLTLNIITAMYRNKNEPSSDVEDVTKLVRNLCGDGNSCAFMVNDKVLPNNLCSECPKELEVTYTCSNHQSIFGPELEDCAYTGNDIVINDRDYISDVDNYLDCGKRCLEVPQCVGIQYKTNHQCYLKSAMVAYTKETGWLSMAVVNRTRYF
ncbi:hypothetical protein I4U23_013692 [Adineta vaga]|nr:hypothetical protein I4U23_013692 [Adineta vaga]